MGATAPLRGVAAGVAAAAVLTACGSVFEPVQALPPGQRVTMTIQVENHARVPMVLHSEHADQSTGDAQLWPCAITGTGLSDGDGRTVAAPFTVHVGTGSIQDGDPRPDYDSMPVIIDSSALSPPPGRAGYRVVIDADGNVSSLEPLDALEEERMAEELC